MKIIILLIMLLAGGCNKDNQNKKNSIPYIPIRFTAYLRDPRLNSLNSPGGVVVLPKEGVAGLIIYRRSDNSYVAFDGCSTVNVAARCTVVPETSFTLTDPCSGAKFFLHDGMPAKAPALAPLKRYDVQVDAFTIYVTN